MSALVSHLYVLLQHVLPKFLLTAIVRCLSRTRSRTIKDLLIRAFINKYGIETEEIAGPVPERFGSFNEFFVRELIAGARPIDPAADAIVSPVDGTVSEAGRLEGRRLLQAKGHHYDLHDLLATDLPDADRFRDGGFITIYLAPHNYHRVHSPLDARLTATRYVPGQLFSVDPRTVAARRGLFAHNERLVCHFSTGAGPMVVVLVGAMLVGSISTRWTGEIRPRRRGVVENFDVSGSDTRVSRGELLGWFNMGSTVIVLLPPGTCAWHDSVGAGTTVRMGESIGRLRADGR